jgi:hypothetical protein
MAPSETAYITNLAERAAFLNHQDIPASLTSRLESTSQRPLTREDFTIAWLSTQTSLVTVTNLKQVRSCPPNPTSTVMAEGACSETRSFTDERHRTPPPRAFEIDLAEVGSLFAGKLTYQASPNKKKNIPLFKL